MTGVKAEIASIVVRVQENFAVRENSESKWLLLRELKTKLSDHSDSELTSVNYCAVLNKLVSSLSVHLFVEKWQEELYDDVFFVTFYHDTFLVLVQQLATSEPSYHQTKILNLLEKFIYRGNMQRMIMDQCFFSDAMKFKYISSSGLWDELITCMITLPDRVANKTKGNLKKIFTPTCYVSLIRSTLFKVLSEICEKLKENQDCSVEFLGKVIGRLCNSGHGLILIKKLIFQLIEICSSDYIWRRVSQNLICKIPSSCMETFIIHFLTNIPWYGYIDWLLGDAILSNQKISYLMTVKFLLVRQFKDIIIPQNIIGYLANSQTRLEVFFKVFESLMTVWADGSILKYQSFPQQHYLGSSLMIYCGHLKNKEINSEIRALLQKALNGATLRLGSSDASVRHLGMIVGESLASALDPSATKLEFKEQEFLPELLKLRELLIVPTQPQLDDFAVNFKMDDPVFVKEKIVKQENNTEVVTPAGDIENTDDDLEPYDLSTDAPDNTVKRPLYIRDCIEGLIESNKPDWTELCLRSAESLIRSNVEATKEVAQEMAKILLHLDNNFAMSDFVDCRFKALVALTVQCPAVVAEYLSSQFYERDYNIRQRLDILEVLACASCELSQPKQKEKKVEPTISTLSLAKPSETWQEIVKKRLEAKTRRFSQGPKKPLPDPELNVFGAVAGYFFFPLMEKFDNDNLKCLNLLREDSYVLGRLLHTLGVIVHSATNTLVSKPMGSALLQFVLAVKNNEEAFVRRSAIFAIMAVILSVSPHVLLTDLHKGILDCRFWLEEVRINDSDAECQMQATKTIELLLYITQEELPSVFRAIEQNFD